MTIARLHLFAAALALAATTAAYAHFPWLVPQPEAGPATSLQIYFGENASPDDPKLLARLKGMKVWQIIAGKDAKELELTAGTDELTVALPKDSPTDAIYAGAHNYGVITRGTETYGLRYYAKTGPLASNPAWQKVSTAAQTKLDIIPSVVDGKLSVRVLFDGKPAVKSEVKTQGPGLESFEGVTDENGVVTIATTAGGICSLRARHIEQTAGEADGKKFDSVRHYCTVALPLEKAVPKLTSSSKIEPIDPKVTSLAAAISGGKVYIYGGNMAGAHSYSNKEQGRRLYSASLQGGAWTKGEEGPALQGLAMVAHQGKLYRLGGFTAKNDPGKEAELESNATVAVYDPATEKWTNIAPLPEPRSSFDAAVIGDVIYVAGGWNLSEKDEAKKWHKTAWKLDLSKSDPQWEALPKAPFQRRALSLAAHEGKIYVIGGMQMEGGVTSRTAIFDPQTGKWSEGPALLGEDKLTGFGNSSFGTGGKLYVSTINGDLQRLSDDGNAFLIVAKMPTARFFHRMVAVDDKHLLVVGGASMTEGKFDAVEIVEVP